MKSNELYLYSNILASLAVHSQFINIPRTPCKTDFVRAHLPNPKEEEVQFNFYQSKWLEAPYVEETLRAAEMGLSIQRLNSAYMRWLTSQSVETMYPHMNYMLYNEHKNY